jgi:hypothetical protein
MLVLQTTASPHNALKAQVANECVQKSSAISQSFVIAEDEGQLIPVAGPRQVVLCYRDGSIAVDNAGRARKWHTKTPVQREISSRRTSRLGSSEDELVENAKCQKSVMARVWMRERVMSKSTMEIESRAKRKESADEPLIVCVVFVCG